MVSCKLVAAAQLLLLLSTATIQVSAAVRPSAHSPPFYPSPRIDGAGSWEAAYVKARQFVDGLTIPEKTNLTTGTGWQSSVCEGNTGELRFFFFSISRCEIQILNVWLISDLKTTRCHSAYWIPRVVPAGLSARCPVRDLRLSIPCWDERRNVLGPEIDLCSRISHGRGV